MADEEEILSLTIDPSGISAGLEAAAAGLEKLAATSEKAAESLGKVVEGGAAEALGAVGGAAEGAAGGVGSFASSIGDAVKGVVDLVMVLGEGAVSLASFAIKMGVDLVDAASDYFLQLQRIHLLTGMAYDSTAAFVVGLAEVGMSAQQAGAGLQFFARQLEGIVISAEAVGGGGRGVNAARRAMEETAAAAQTEADQIADANQRMADAAADATEKIAQAHADSADKIKGIIDDEKSKLDDLAEKHQETVAKINASLANENADFAQKEADRASDYAASLEDLGQKHQDNLDKISQREADANDQNSQAAIDAAQRKAERIESIEQSLQDSLDDIHRTAAEKAAHSERTKNENLEDENRHYGERMSEFEYRLAHAKPTEFARIQHEIELLQISHQDKLFTIQRSFADRTADNAQSAADAELKARRKEAEEITKISEEHTHKRASRVAEQIASENKAYAEQLKSEGERHTISERNAKESHDKKLRDTNTRLAQEDAAYAEAVEKEKARADKSVAAAKVAEAKKVVAIQESLEKQERAHTESLDRIERAYEEHLAKIAQMEANSSGGGGKAPKESAFEITLRKILLAAGEAQTKVDEIFAKLKSGEDLTLGQIGLDNIAEGFKRLQDAADHGGASFNAAGEAAKLFGRNGALMLPFLLQGKEGFEAAKKKAQEYGLTLSEEGVEHSRAFVKAQADMNLAMMGVKETIGLALQPAFTSLFSTVATFVANHRDGIKKWADDSANAIEKWAKNDAWPVLKGLLKDVSDWFEAHHQEIQDDLVAILGKFKDVGEWVANHKEEIYGFLVKLKDLFAEFGRWITEHKTEVLLFLAALALAFGALVVELALTVAPFAAIVVAIGAIALAVHAINWPNVWSAITNGLSTTLDGIGSYIDDNLIAPLNATGVNIPYIHNPSGNAPHTYTPEEIAAIGAGANPNPGAIGGHVAGPASPWPGDDSNSGSHGSTGAFASGLWEVPGSRGVGDTVPAWLSPGELVMPAGIADQYRSGRGGGNSTDNHAVSVNFNGPLYVVATDQSQAQQAADDFANRLALAVRSRGAA